MSHYMTCGNCGEPECMDSDTGVHRRDDGTICPDPRDAEIARLRAEVETWRNRYESACLDRDVAEAKVAGDWPNALVEAQRDRAESAEARVAELEAAAWELFQAFDGTDVALQAQMLDKLRALIAPEVR